MNVNCAYGVVTLRRDGGSRIGPSRPSSALDDARSIVMVWIETWGSGKCSYVQLRRLERTNQEAMKDEKETVCFDFFIPSRYERARGGPTANTDRSVIGRS